MLLPPLLPPPRHSASRLLATHTTGPRTFRRATEGMPGDSAPAGLAAPAPTTVSAVEMVQESRQQSAAVSEGVASAGAPAPPQAVVGECTGDAGLQSAALGGFQGETSGAPSSELPGGGSNYGCGENGGASPMDTALPATGSAMLPGTSGHGAALRHAAGSSHPAKRKLSEVGEVGDSMAAGGGGSGNAGAPMEHDEAPSSWQAAPKADGSWGTLDRVPSDQGVMLVGGAEGTSPPAAGGGGEGVQLRDEGDSAAARSGPQQQQQQDAVAALATLAEGTGVRPSDAEILEWEEQIRWGCRPGGPPCHLARLQTPAAPFTAAVNHRIAWPASSALPSSLDPDLSCPASPDPHRQQETGSQPLIGNREPLASLAAEYESGAARWPGRSRPGAGSRAGEARLTERAV